MTALLVCKGNCLNGDITILIVWCSVINQIFKKLHEGVQFQTFSPKTKRFQPEVIIVDRQPRNLICQDEARLQENLFELD